MILRQPGWNNDIHQWSHQCIYWWYSVIKAQQSATYSSLISFGWLMCISSLKQRFGALYKSNWSQQSPETYRKNHCRQIETLLAVLWVFNLTCKVPLRHEHDNLKTVAPQKCTSVSSGPFIASGSGITTLLPPFRRGQKPSTAHPGKISKNADFIKIKYVKLHWQNYQTKSIQKIPLF